eukprot:GHVR01157491.1.p1 GENE.GHVR01157491.1~~GHVR01157491.1.p1  ORF type:complete len:112 (-),score=1.04 GHVR01157491.1:8-343(-)
MKFLRLALSSTKVYCFSVHVSACIHESSHGGGFFPSLKGTPDVHLPGRLVVSGPGLSSFGESNGRDSDFHQILGVPGKRGKVPSDSRHKSFSTRYFPSTPPLPGYAWQITW